MTFSLLGIATASLLAGAPLVDDPVDDDKKKPKHQITYTFLVPGFG